MQEFLGVHDGQECSTIINKTRYSEPSHSKGRRLKIFLTVLVNSGGVMGVVGGRAGVSAGKGASPHVKAAPARGPPQIQGAVGGGSAPSPPAPPPPPVPTPA